MKPAHWLAVLVLALMVGGITFVMVYIGSDKGPAVDPDAGPNQTLSFASKKYPEAGAPALVSEVNQPARQDYWFTNDTGRELAVGLNAKSCKCSDVDIVLVPDSYRAPFVQIAAARVVGAFGGPLDLLCLAACQQKLVSGKTDRLAETATPLNLDNEVKVPPGAIGWVRLHWVGDKAQARILNADLWMGEKGGRVNAVLVAGGVIVDPILVEKEVAVGTLGMSDLKKGKKMWIYCWSATRRSFHLKVERVHERARPESDPFEVGTPEPLSEADRRTFAEKFHMLPLRSGYRIPVTLRAEAPDGTPFQLGHFRHFLTVTSPDPGIEPVQVAVTGRVQGDVTVGDARERGAIQLGSFESSAGKEAEISLDTDVPGLNLELDEKRIPRFLQASLPDKPDVAPTGHRTWRLTVKVRRGAAHGQFPRPDDPEFRDSAIYVQIKAAKEKTRLIRIPVLGTATDG